MSRLPSTSWAVVITFCTMLISGTLSVQEVLAVKSRFPVS